MAEARENCKDNVVITSKYNMFTFIPVNLFQQMSKAANIYFMVITILQTIKVISISNGEPTMLPPLILVIATSMIKDAYEDYCRHIEDAAENNARCKIFNRRRNIWEDSRWGDAKIGDFIMVRQDEFFPADMVIVKSTEEEGVCYVETKNLDGETNLKNKNVPKDLWSTFDHAPQAIQNFEGTLEIEGPNNLIYKFDGNVQFEAKNVNLTKSNSNF